MAVLRKILFALVAAAVLVAGYWLFTFNDPVKTIEIRTGTIANFSIGESKVEMLSRRLVQSFSPQPKPSKCSDNWIVMSQMTEVQKTCLLHTDIWDVGDLTALCPPRTDEHTSLHFSGGKLAMVLVRCSRAE